MSRNPLSLRILAAVLLLAIIMELVPGSSASLLSARHPPGPLVVTPSFSFTPTNPGVGQVVTFTGGATGGTAPYSFSWNFGDGVLASGSSVKHIFISLQTFTVSLTATDSIGGTNSVQNSVYVGSLNSRVNCTPTIVRITDITANQTGTASQNTSPYYPGITSPIGAPKRWLTPGATPPGWQSPGPPCTITNQFTQTISTYVEIDGIKRASTTNEDPSSSYDPVNGGGSYGGATINDFTFNSFDPAIATGNSCTTATDPTCYGKIHMEMDHDWQAAGYCGPGTTCDPITFSSGTTDAVTLIDFQGFVFWDAPSCCSSPDHSFSGWELHPLTGWRVHQSPLTVSFSYSPPSPTSGQTVTFTGSASGGTGSYTFTWDFGDGTTGTGTSATHTFSAGSYNVHLSVTDSNGAVGVVSQTVTVGSGTADFSISSSPSSLTFLTGSSGSSTINLASLNGFSGTVSLSSTVSPSGLTASLSPTSVSLTSGGSGSSTLTLSSSTPGSYTVTVTGTNGALSHAITVSVSVVSTPDFSISSSPSSLSIQSPSTATSTISLTSISSFSGTVSLSTTVLPSGVTASLNPASLTLASGGSATSTLTLSSSTPGSYTVTVTGTSGSLSHSSTVLVAVVASPVATDAALGPSSLATDGGEKLIQDSAGRMIAVYVDSSGRVGLAYANSNPSQVGWSTPVKSATPVSAYAWPAAVLVSLTSLRIIAGGGSGPGMITDIPVTVLRDAQNNITGFTFGTPTTLDSSGLGSYPAAVLAHNGDILLAWGWLNSTRSLVKALRWHPSTGWTNFAGSSSIPDIVLLDSASLSYFTPNMIERPDNNNVYLVANRFPGPPSTIAFNKASWNGSGWSWGAQNLTYEGNASDADDDFVSLTWDPLRSLVVAAYGITGTHTYGVFTLNSQDLKTHNDTPTLTVTDRGWGEIGVHTTTGDYYIFLINVNTDGGSGPLGYIRLPSGGSWNATINWLDTATDNQVVNVRPTGASPTLDLLYAEGTAAPVKVKFIRLSPPNPPDFTISASPTNVTVQAGSSGTSTITLTSLYSFAGTVTLSTTVSPSGLTASLSPASVALTGGGTATSMLTLSSTKPGTYNVTIQGMSGSLSHSVKVTVTVTDVGPTVSFTESATTVPTGTAITLTISASDLDGTVSSLKVIWGDGTIDTLAATAASDTHSYTLPGSYTVYLNATDNANLTTKSSTATKTITDRPPVVSFTESATTALTGTSITLAITASDPDGTVSSLKVVWGDGTIDSLAGSATSDGHAYSVAGSYQVYVNATDNSGSTIKSAVATKTITDRPPIVSFTESATTVSTGTSITLTITTSDPDGTISSLKVSWGDGTVDTLAGSATSDSHAYSSTGTARSATFSVYVNATDNSGSTTKSSTATKTVNDLSPTVSFTESASTVPTGSPITLTIAATDPDGTIASLEVSWGDGTVDTLAGLATSDSHAYSVAGSYQAYVNATDNSGSTTKSSVAAKTITDRPPTVSFSESATTAPTGTGITLTITVADPDGTVASMKVSWGDGTIDSLATTATSDTHSYALAGSYAVYVNATDNANLTTKSPTATKTITDRPPTVSFTESATTAPTGTGITLTITAADPDGAVSSLKVVWGDGTIDNLAGSATSDNHAYSVAGSYHVYLNATDNSGSITKSSIATKTVTDRPPTVGFTESATTAPTGTSITLTITAADPDGTIVSLKVSWGDGIVDTLAGSTTSDSHAYSVAGTYQVYVNATDNSGSTTKSAMATKTITDRPPTVSFTESATTVSTGTSITLTITTSDPDGTVASLKVSWGDGTVDTLAGSATSDNHSYSSTGSAPSATFTVYVNATDNSGSTTKSSTATKTVNDRPPTISFTESATTVPTSTPITLTIIPADPDGTIASLKVSWGDGTVDTLAGSATSDSHAYSVKGSYQVYVNATDNSGSATKSSVATKTITDRPPIVSFSESATTAPTGSLITLNITTTDPDGTVTGVKVVWGDGTIDNLAGSTTGDTHSYALAGSYTVYVNATDNTNLTTKSSTATKTITDRPPTVGFTESGTTAPTGTSITLTITASDPDGTVTGLRVSWGDGTVDSLAGTATSDSHSYSLAGQYSVYVNATDNANLTTRSSTATKTITDRPPAISFTESATTIPTGTEITLTISSSDPDGTVTAIKVVWGDGTVDNLAGTGTTDSHAYSLAGTYQVYVNSTDNANLTTKGTVATKTITDRPPAVTFTETATTAPTGTSITLTITSSDPDGTVNSLKVSWGDGTVDSLPGPATSDSHSYSHAGSYGVYVNASDNANLTAKSIVAVKTITDRPPTVSFTESATTVPTRLAINLTISTSDPDGTVNSLKVVWGDGTIDTLAGTAIGDSHSYSVAGSYQVYVNATDNSGSTTKSALAAKTITDRPPVINFTESATTIPTGTAITLTITPSDPDGTVTILKVVWGDGTIETLAGTATSDSHSYSMAGSYNVYVNATDNANLTTKSAVAVKTISDRAPTVSFSESATTVPTGSSISLTISASDPDGSVTAIRVVWGDGKIDNLAGTGTSDSHSYSLAGSYTVYVNATDNANLITKSSIGTKTVTERAPTVSFTESATTAPTGASVTLTITAADPDGTVSSLKVVWGDGTIDSLAGSATSDTHSYALAGSYTVYVNATDNANLTTKSNIAVKTITDIPPIVGFSESATIVPTGTPITLTISASDPDGTVASLKISWGDGTVHSLAGNATSDSHSYSVGGSYTVYANATDNSGSTTKSGVAAKMITDRPPTVSFTESATTVSTGTSITLTITASDPDGTVTGLRVVWGDGTIDNLAGAASSDSHSYALAGTYNVYANATDNANLTTKSAVAAKTITDRPPAISFTESTMTAPTGTPITMTISASDPDGTVTSVKVSWGDGTVHSLAGNTTSDSHSYAVAGSYTVYVNATDNANLISKSATATNTIGDHPPTVSFTESATTAPTGTQIMLVITSADPDGTVTSLKVAWGDGMIDSLAGSGTNDTHSYALAGSYTVYVNATDNANLATKSGVAVKTITDRAPTVSFTESATTIPTGTSITLSISASDPDGTVSSIKVSWGDGTVDSLPGSATSDSHSYSAAGSYSVYVNATDNANLAGKSAIAVKTITDRPPTISFSESASTAPSGSPITLTISASDPDGSVISMKVVWGDGSIDTLAGSAISDSHSYSVAGSYQVYVNATDNSGSTAKSAVAAKAITDRPPTVSFTESATTVPTGTTITLTITSSDPDGSVTSLKVAWGDGTVDSLAGTAISDSHSYALAGSYNVYVNATDNANLTTKSSMSFKTIADRPPTVGFTESATTAPTGTSITLTITAADPDGTVPSLRVVWGDGTIDTLAGTAIGDSHSYSVAGGYQVYVNATDNSGSTTKSAVAAKTITDRSPTASFTESASSALTQVSISFNATASNDSDGTIASYAWTFGDGGTATGAIVTHSYANTGNAKTATFTVALTVTDNSGNTGTAQSTKTITDRNPTASFTEAATSVTNGTSISFNAGASSDPDGTITGYSWNFGDTTTGIGATTSHTYVCKTPPCTFTVTLTVTDNSGNAGTAQSTKTVTADEPPTASFTESATSALTGVSITFNGTASSDPDGHIASWAWTFGDGGTASGAVVSHSYANTSNAKTATFTVTLMVTDNSTLTGSAQTIKTITDRSPTASFTESATSALTQVSISFNATASSDPDGAISTYAWNFGDGSTGTGKIVSHSYPNTGNSKTATFPVTLTVTDTSGNTGIAQSTKTITDRNPTASFTESATSVTNGTSISFNAGPSSDPDGTIVSYSWNFGDTSTGTGVTTSHTYVCKTSPCTFTVTLTVTDNSGETGTAQSTKTVRADENPTASFSESATSALTSVSITFNATASSDPDGHIVNYAWTFGDGSTGNGAIVSHSYANTGNVKIATFTVTLTVTDNSTLTGTAQAVKTIADRNPVASFTESATSDLTQVSISFNATASSDPDGTISTYAWTFGDGSTGTGKIVSHSYANTGNAKTATFTVTLNVTDNSGNSATTTALKTITDRNPTASFTESATSALTQVTINFNATASSDPDGTTSTYSWTFGDGGTATGAVVSHIYSSTGNSKTQTFTVTLTATDNSGNTGSASSTKAITDQNPTARFTESTASSTVGTFISFNATTSNDPDGTISTYSWNFGDTGTATGATTSHSYSTTGNFTVTLTVTDNSGNTGTATALKTITLKPPPTAKFTESVTTALTLVAINFNASQSSSPNGPIVSYSWNFGDGSPIATLATPTTSHTYMSTGSTPTASYTVTLTVTDGVSLTNSATSIKTITDRVPVASFTESTTSALTQVPVSFNATANSDLDGTINTYSWNFGDGGTGTGKTVSHSYANTGNTMTQTFTVTLTVTDNSGSTGTATATKTIIDQNPTARFTESTTTAPTGTSITLTITASDPDGTVTGLRVSWGDGKVDSLAGSATSDSHSYSSTDGVPSATFTLYVNATDNSGSITKSSTATKTINDRPPTISFTESASTVPTGTPVTLTITAADPDGTIASLKVSWGDGTVDTLAASATSDSHAYSVAGTYQAYVNATDNSGSTTKSSAATKTITDFSVNANVNSLSLAAGSTGSVTINMTSINGFTGTVSLSAVSSPTGPKLDLSSSSVLLSSSGSGTSILTVRVMHRIQPGIYKITITATSGGLIHTATVMLTVT